MIAQSSNESGIARKPSGRTGASTVVNVLALLAIAALVIALLLPMRRSATGAARRAACVNQLRQISLALYNYEEKYHALPPAHTVDAAGKPLHSWRTLILPFLEELPLYRSIDLTKPWDDPANAKALRTEVSAYHCPEADTAANHTTYLAVVAPDSVLQPAKPRPFSEISDGIAKTLVVIEVPSDKSVPWMSPQDASEELVMAIGRGVRSPHDGGFNALFVDGSVRFFFGDLPADDRRAMITISGGEKHTPPE